MATGGRVLGVTALGDDVLDAQTKAYQVAHLVLYCMHLCEGLTSPTLLLGCMDPVRTSGPRLSCLLRVGLGRLVCPGL